MLHVGITGYNAAGKGEVIEYLKKLGYKTLSLSDILREEAKSQNLEPTRENLTNLGQKLRKQLHPGFLAEKTLFHMDHKSQYAIDSIRHPDEIKILKQHLKNFILIGVDAPAELRFERSKVRGRQENADTLKEFIDRQKLEMKNNPNAQQLHKCMEMCDAVIMNDGSLGELQAKVQEILEHHNLRA